MGRKSMRGINPALLNNALAMSETQPIIENESKNVIQRLDEIECSCGKISYLTMFDALEAIKNLSKTIHRQGKAYKCELCKLYHISFSSKNRK